MAAIDPTETPEVAEGSSKAAPARATLKLIRQPLLDLGDDDSDASFDQDEMDALLAEEDSEEDEESSDGETDEKAADGMTKKERNLAVAAKLKAALEADGMEVDIPNGIKKAKADAEDDEDDEDDDEDDDDESIEADEEFVICTLDAEKVCVLIITHNHNTADINTELPAAHQHHHRCRRGGLLQGRWQCHNPPDW